MFVIVWTDRLQLEFWVDKSSSSKSFNLRSNHKTYEAGAGA